MEPYDEGLVRNLHKLFGRGSDFEGMDKPLESVVLVDDAARIRFTFADGSIVSFHVDGDCCSSSWIEHLTAPDDIRGETISEIYDRRISESADDEHECLQVYNTIFRTPKGDIILEYRNSSNGYYGGYLVRERG